MTRTDTAAQRAAAIANLAKARARGETPAQRAAAIANLAKARRAHGKGHLTARQLAADRANLAKARRHRRRHHHAIRRHHRHRAAHHLVHHHRHHHLGTVHHRRRALHTTTAAALHTRLQHPATLRGATKLPASYLAASAVHRIRHRRGGMRHAHRQKTAVRRIRRHTIRN